MNARTSVSVIGLLATLSLALSGAHAHAQPQLLDVPISGSVDPRVRSVLFQEDAVVSLRGHYGYQMTVEFGTDERIENVSIGDSLAWQVTPNRRADTLFLKPIEFDAATNMSVITSKRRYTFQLSAEEPIGAGDPNIIYRVKFTFLPDAVTKPEEVIPTAVVTTNRDYSLSGSVRNMPTQIYDDGTLTYFEWSPGTPTPAVFAVGTEGKEALVNFGMRGPMMVVERIAPAFILRNGADETRVNNDGWREPALGTQVLQVRSAPNRSNNTRSPSLLRRWFGARSRTP